MRPYVLLCVILVASCSRGNRPHKPGDEWLKEDFRLDHLILDKVEVALKRDPDGSYQIARLMKPGPETKSTWTSCCPRSGFATPTWLDVNVGAGLGKIEVIAVGDEVRGTPFAKPAAPDLGAGSRRLTRRGCAGVGIVAMSGP